MKKTTITSPNSSAILNVLLSRYAPRNVVLFHRAILQNNISFVKECLSKDPGLYAESTLLPIEVYEEVVLCDDVETISFEGFEVFPRIKVQTEPYPLVHQLVTGDFSEECRESNEVNELYPTGNEAETNLDTVFFTPLMRACQTANLEIVTLLLQQPNVTIDYLTPCSNNAIFCTLSNTNPNKIDAVISILKLISNKVNCNDTCYINSILNKSTTKPILLQTLMALGYPINEEQDIATLKYRVHPNLYQIIYDHLFDYE